jgi:DNA-directed RNA polymerase specialized sigma24 family protein
MKNKPLTPRQYEAVRLFYIKNERYDAIAKAMGLNKRTVELHLYNARKRIGRGNSRKAIVSFLNSTIL